MATTRLAVCHDRGGCVAEADEPTAVRARRGLQGSRPEDLAPSRVASPDAAAGRNLYSVAAAAPGSARDCASDDDPGCVAPGERMAGALGAVPRRRALRDDIPNSRLEGRLGGVDGCGERCGMSAMGRAIDAAAARVAPHAQSTIATYPGLSFGGFSTRVTYPNRYTSAAGRTATVRAYRAVIGVSWAVARFRHGRRGGDALSAPGPNRGSDPTNWLGGYPGERARPHALVAHLSDRLDGVVTGGADGPKAGIGAGGRAEFVSRPAS